MILQLWLKHRYHKRVLSSQEIPNFDDCKIISVHRQKIDKINPTKGAIPNSKKYHLISSLSFLYLKKKSAFICVICRWIIFPICELSWTFNLELWAFSFELIICFQPWAYYLLSALSFFCSESPFFKKYALKSYIFFIIQSVYWLNF